MALLVMMMLSGGAAAPARARRRPRPSHSGRGVAEPSTRLRSIVADEQLREGPVKGTPAAGLREHGDGSGDGSGAGVPDLVVVQDDGDDARDLEGPREQLGTLVGHAIPCSHCHCKGSAPGVLSMSASSPIGDRLCQQ